MRPALSCGAGCLSRETWPSERSQTRPPPPESCRQSSAPEMSEKKEALLQHYNVLVNQ